MTSSRPGRSLLATGGSFFCLTLLALQSACLSTDRRSRPNAFDWETDLPALETKTNEGVGQWTGASNYDKNFCKNQKSGSCFSLVIRIPKTDLVQDLGLSVLALGSSSKNMRARMDESCQAAWTDYRQKYLYDNIHPLRRDFVKNISKMRCIYQFMGEEVSTENIKLAQNEIGLSARMTKFEILGDDKSAEARNFGIQIQSKSVQTQFRSVYLYSGSDLKTQNIGWQTASGLGVAPVTVSGTIDRKVQWKIDYEALRTNLEKVATDPAATQTAISSFFTLAKTKLATVTGASSPASASLLMVGMGYNAYRTLCGENHDLCKASTNQSVLTNGVNEDLADLVPSSDTNELLRLAMIRSIQSVMDEALSKTNADQVKQSFGIK